MPALPSLWPPFMGPASVLVPLEASGFIAEFQDMLPDTATIAYLAGRDRYGERTYGAESDPIRCRLVREHKLVRDAQGDEVVSTAHLWLGVYVDLSPDDRVTLSDGTQPPIITVERFQDEDGASHTKAYFR